MIGTVVVGHDVWLVKPVKSCDPVLVDKTGHLRAATTDPLSKTINLSVGVEPPLLDKVVLHEVAHAMVFSHGLLSIFSAFSPEEINLIEEWAAQLIETHSIDAIEKASSLLNRPLCVKEHCMTCKSVY